MFEPISAWLGKAQSQPVPGNWKAFRKTPKALGVERKIVTQSFVDVDDAYAAATVGAVYVGYCTHACDPWAGSWSPTPEQCRWE